MRSVDIEELRGIQMDILEIIDKFCKKNNICYSLACGTLLGAIRHHGYIPWDDDIDIYIPREDYRRLISIFPEEHNSVKIISTERDSKWNRAYSQAYDCRTIMHEYANTPVTVGVHIDIYPIDRVPDSEIKWLLYNVARRTLIRAYELKYVNVKWKRSILKNILLILGKILLLPFNSRQLAILISRFAQIFNGKGYSRSFENVQGMLQKRPFKSSLMTEFMPISFENRQFMIMKNYDEYLSNGYGDYMQLPPVEKRVSHHKFKAYWKD